MPLPPAASAASGRAAGAGPRVLTVCTGNLCRSPLAELALQRHAPGVLTASAGLGAVVGAGMDADAAAAARALGLEPGLHRAQQFTDPLARAADLILVMEQHHRADIARRWPHLTGKTFLLGRFLEGREIPDPYRRSAELHATVARLIDAAAAAWAPHLAALRR